MLKKKNDDKGFFLGIDGGGSKCKAIVVNENNEILGSGVSGPANPLYGFDQAIHSITTSAQLALKDAQLHHIKLNNLNVGVGLAGVNLPIQLKQMQCWQHPFKTLDIAHDLFIACYGAHTGNNGAVIVTGTGSCGYSLIEGKEHLIGGHGFPQGDKASGAWFGLKATEYILLSEDGLVAPTILREHVINQLDCEDASQLVEKVVGENATFYAQIANTVFDAAEQGDKAAIAIIEDGADYINNVAKKLLTQKNIRLSMLGGLAPRLKPWLHESIRSQLSEPLNLPEMGAILYARQLSKS